MRDGIQWGIDIQAGRLLWKLTSFLCGLLLLPVLGLALAGHAVLASVWVCVVLAVHRGVWRFLLRRMTP
jgi:hypothetical protein